MNEINNKDRNCPLVSFIITTRDETAETLPACIESVLSLSLAEYEREIIVVDEASQKSVINDLGQLKDAITYIRTGSSRESEARNLGLRISTGQFVQFVGASDHLCQPAYEHCLDLLRYNSPDVVVFRKGRTAGAGAVYKETGCSGTEYLKGSVAATVDCYLFERSMAGTLQFNSHRDYAAEEEFIPQLLLRSEKLLSTNAVACITGKTAPEETDDEDRRTTLRKLEDSMATIVHLRRLADTLPYRDNIALKRQLAWLAMEFIEDVITASRSYDFTRKKLDELRDLSLFPLPDYDYGRQYSWIRRLSKNALGLRVLILTLRRHKEKK